MIGGQIMIALSTHRACARYTVRHTKLIPQARRSTTVSTRLQDKTIRPLPRAGIFMTLAVMSLLASRAAADAVAGVEGH